MAALVLVAPAQSAPLLAAGLGRRPRALDAAAGFRSTEGSAFPYNGELLDAVRHRLAQPEVLSGNEPWQLTNLLAGWGAEAAPALPELCAALPRVPGQAARAIAAVAADCAPADRARAATSLRAVAAEQGVLPAAKALYDLDGDIAPLLHCLEQDLRRGANQLREAATMAAALGPRAAALVPALCEVLNGTTSDTTPRWIRTRPWLRLCGVSRVRRTGRLPFWTRSLRAPNRTPGPGGRLFGPPARRPSSAPRDGRSPLAWKPPSTIRHRQRPQCRL